MEEQHGVFTAEFLEHVETIEAMAQQQVSRVPPASVIADFVRLQRHFLSLKKEALASLAGVSLSTIERIERGASVSTESLERVAAALYQPKGAFTEPRIPIGSEAALDRLEESLKPLGKASLNDIAELREFLDFASFMIVTDENPHIFQMNRKDRVRRRDIYRLTLDRVREIERRGTAVALTGIYEAATNAINMPKVSIALIAFFPKSSDPGTVKRKVLYTPPNIDMRDLFKHLYTKSVFILDKYDLCIVMMNFRRFVKIIVRNGFSLDRQDGSHRIYKGVLGGTVRIVVVAFHRESDEIKPGTLASMIRQSGLDKKLFR